MKRKDWISLVAMLIILGIALIGEQFHANGKWVDGTISLFTKLLPLLVFFIISVYFRNKKGSYSEWYRRLSYVSFAFAVIFLLLLSKPFMHYFNIIGSQHSIATASSQILADCEEMFREYDKQVSERVVKFESELTTAINQRDNPRYKELLETEYPTETLFDRNFKIKAVDAWKDLMFTNCEANKQAFEKTKKLQFETVLVKNFDAFSAAGELKELLDQYNTYKKLLVGDFSKTTPFERIDGYSADFQFENQEHAWMDSQFIFTHMEFNIGWFLLYLILVAFACSSYLFFKDENVRAPRLREGCQSVYEKGYNMSK